MLDLAEHPEPGDVDFPFAFDWPERLAGLFFGVSPDSAWLALRGERLIAHFGPWVVDTTLDNVEGAELTGPYRWPRIIGPAHLSLADRGLTFASTNEGGVCIRFRTPVAGLDPLGVVRHPSLTVTVDDAPALVEMLNAAARRAADNRDRVRRHPDRPVATEPATVEDVLDEVNDDLHALTAKELRRRARELGIDGAASMKKAELLEALTHHHTAD
jgi:hypothetical protein